MSHDHFDSSSATYDDDLDNVERARLVAEGIRAATSLSGGESLLEYGAGTGSPSLRRMRVSTAPA